MQVWWLYLILEVQITNPITYFQIPFKNRITVVYGQMIVGLGLAIRDNEILKQS